MLGTTWQLGADILLRRHGGDFKIFDSREVDKKGLLAIKFSPARKQEKRRAERERKSSFWETFLRLFSNSVTCRKKSFTGNPFLLTSLLSERAESLPCQYSTMMLDDALTRRRCEDIALNECIASSVQGRGTTSVR